jgi:hypothetical protein
MEMWSASHFGRSTPRESPWYSPDSKLGELLSRSGRCGEKNLLPLPKIEPRFLGRLAHTQSLYRLSYPGKKKKVKLSLHHAVKAHKVVGNRHPDGGGAVSLMRRPSFTPPGRFLVQRLSRPQGHSAAGRIRSNEKSNDLIGHGTRDLPVCSIVPQPTTLPRAPL